MEQPAAPPKIAENAPIKAPTPSPLVGPVVPAAEASPTIRFAEWRVEGAEINGAWGLWKHAFGLASRIAWLLFVLVCVAIGYASLTRSQDDVIAHVIVAVFAGLAIAVPFLKRGEKQRKATNESMYDAGPLAQFPATVWLLRGRSIIAFDQGLASVVDGRLFFASRRLSFSFSPRAARVVSGQELVHNERFQSKAMFFSYTRDGTTYTAGIMPQWDETSGARLLEMLTGWESFTPEPGSVDVLPPTTAAPDAILRYQTLYLKIVAVSAGICLLVNSALFGGWFSSDDAQFDLTKGVFTASLAIFFVIALGSWASLRQERRRIESPGTGK